MSWELGGTPKYIGSNVINMSDKYIYFMYQKLYKFEVCCKVQLVCMFSLFAGLDSRYFDMFDPPSDITFVDLDTCTITV